MLEFNCAKVDNCFVDAQTYEYQTPISNERLILAMADHGISVEVNRQFRRPIFKGTLEDGTRFKGILAGDIQKVSFPKNQWQAAKMAYEALLGKLLEGEE